MAKYRETKSSCPCKQLPLCLSSFTAAEYGDLHTLSRLGSSVAKKVDNAGYTPLHLAAQNGHVAATVLLLEMGADVNGKNTTGKGCGATPLHRASYSGAVSTMRVLLDEKWSCDISATDSSFGDDMTALHKAAAGGRYLAVKLLLDVLRSKQEDAGGGPSMLQQGLQALDSSGRTPLDVVIELSKNQEEEQQSVRRWDVVAGGAADWEKCVSLLRNAENEIRPLTDESGSTEWFQHATINSTLPALPKHLSNGASCLDCGGGTGDGNCLTASWEAAFRSALAFSISDESSSIEPMACEQAVQDSTVAEIKALQPSERPEDVVDDSTSNVGRACSSCGTRSFALYPSPNGGLVCRSCFKPSKRIIHR